MASKLESYFHSVLLIVIGFVAGCGGLSPNGNPGPTPNPQPSVTSVTPNSTTVGGSSFTLVVIGTNFVSASTVLWNGSLRTTTFVSSTQLQAQITAADFVTAGTAAVTVSTPAPGGGTSSSASFSINNPPPTISSLAPSSSAAGGAAFALTVNGTNFVSSSTVLWNAGVRTTTFVSSTQLQAQITAADIATGGADMVTVSNPAPGGGTSASSTFTVNNPVPTTASLNPNSAFAGTGAFTLTVTGTNFVSSSSVQWNGAARSTTFVSPTTLRAAISAADISTMGTASVTVFNPLPGGGTSAALTFTIKAPGPSITQLTPSSAIAGGAAFTMTVTGGNFVPASVVQWNGSPRTTTFVSSTSLQAAITTADIAAAGVVNVTISNPPANGGMSAPSTFFTGTTGASNFAVITVNQLAKDIVYDPVHQLFYLSVTGTASTHPNTISILDPATGTIPSAQAAGSNPNVLAISDDSQLLYAGIDGSSTVQRFTLPAVTPDISYPLGSSPSAGPFRALDLQVAPGFPHTTAVSLAVSTSTPAAQGGITIFDDATARPTIAKGFGPGGGGGVLYDSLQWGADATVLLAADNEDTGFDFYTLAVSSSGVALNKDFRSVFNAFGSKIHFDAGTNLIYADEGHVVNPSTGAVVGTFNNSGRMVPDSSLNKAFFLTGIGSPTVTIKSLDLNLFTQIGSISISGVIGNPVRLIRWGQNGLAFNTDGGQIFIIGGNFVR